MSNLKLLSSECNNADDELRDIEIRLMQLEEEKLQLLQRKKTLNELKTQIKPSSNLLSTDQKIRLFQSLFKGRTDIFANRWQNTQGRSGYSVACHNEWLPGKCNKPKVKCSECTYRQYKALDQQVIYDHLSGKQVVGLYPLLEGNTCYLLAADFDKTDWQAAVQAMAQVCHEYHVPYALERSRSRNGVHLWIFFSEAVLAKDARALVFGLLGVCRTSHVTAKIYNPRYLSNVALK